MIETAKQLMDAFDKAGETMIQETGAQERDVELQIDVLDYRSYLRPILQHVVEIGTPMRPVKAGFNWHCDRCRRPISEGWIHCSWCGQRLEWEEDSEK